MVYYCLDGELAAVKFKEQGGPKKITLSKDFVLKQQPNIYISTQGILITSVMKSSEDRESTGEQTETLFWSNVHFGATRVESSPMRLRGKGYLSDDGQYMLTSLLANENESRCCKIEVHLIGDGELNMNMKSNLLGAKCLNFANNHPHLECLDLNEFNFLNANDGTTKPLIAIHQTSSVGSRLLFWDTNSYASVYEIDLTLNKVR